MKYVVLIWLLCSWAYAGTVLPKSNISQQLDSKIESFLGDKSYAANKAFINIIFKNPKRFFTLNKVEDIKVIETLKNNGLLQLFYKHPRQLSVSFKTNGTPLFFIKLVSHALRSIGYYRYITKEVNSSLSSFVWTIDFTSDYAIDPTILYGALNKLGCSIVNVSLTNKTFWHYQIDMQNAHLSSVKLQDNLQVNLNRPLYPPWFNVSAIKKIQITSNAGNSWYPYIVFYDKDLKILKIRKINKKIAQISLNMPKESVYMKINDLYTLQNIGNGLKIIAGGVR